MGAVEAENIDHQVLVNENEFLPDLLHFRTVFTDPEVHRKLHENHVERYSNYFGYWYKQDLFAYDSRYQAVLTNGLIEASLAGGWLSFILWAGSLAFILIQKFAIR